MQPVSKEAHNTEWKPDPIELAWAAGFFDGEGCTHRQTYRSQKLKTRVTIEVNQSNPEQYELKRFMKATGNLGSITIKNYKKDDLSESWQWRAVDHKASVVMERIYPYLCSVKKDQANNKFTFRFDNKEFEYNESKECQYAWCAGFIDAEAHIRHRNPRENHNRGTLNLCIVQTSTIPLERFIKFTQSPMSIKHETKILIASFRKAIAKGYKVNTDNHKPRYKVDAYGKNVIRIISSVYPYLCPVKRKQYDDAYAKYDSFTSREEPKQ